MYKLALISMIMFGCRTDERRTHREAVVDSVLLTGKDMTCYGQTEAEGCNNNPHSERHVCVGQGVMVICPSKRDACWVADPNSTLESK